MQLKKKIVCNVENINSNDYDETFTHEPNSCTE